MKNLFRSIFSNVAKCMAAVAVTAAVTSCNDNSFIFDSEGDCDPHYYVRFEYTMHMEKGDAFKEQVEAVDLFIFDENTGEYVDHIYSTVADMAPGYLLPINVKPGKYKFVAWCGDKDNRHFKINDDIRHHSHATCRLEKRSYEDKQAVSNENLDLLFHGKLENADLPDHEGSYIYTIPLTRDVNNIKITLQHVSGEFDTEHKDIKMLDQNGSLLYDNMIDTSDEHILYRPWSISTGTLENAFEGAQVKRLYDINDEDNADGSTGNFMKIELSTSRLMADHNPVINITDSETGQTIFQIPLIKWILQLRSDRFTEMGDQEYLDRKNEHELMVFLQDDGRGGWTAVSIMINGWHIIDNGVENL